VRLWSGWGRLLGRLIHTSAEAPGLRGRRLFALCRGEQIVYVSEVEEVYRSERLASTHVEVETFKNE
jgi:hypothetical protein